MESTPNEDVNMLTTCELCLTFCDPKDCSPPGSSVHGVLQARILEWVTITFSRGSFYPRDRTWVSCIAGRLFAISPPGKSAPPQEALKSSVCLSLSCTCCWPCNTSRWAAVLTSMGLCYTCWSKAPCVWQTSLLEFCAKTHLFVKWKDSQQ